MEKPARPMTRAEALKAYAAEKLKNFLITENEVPESVRFVVQYKESAARVDFDMERVREIFEGDDMRANLPEECV